MKKLLTLTFAMLLAFVLVACGGGGSKPQSLEISAPSKSILIGRSVQLKATVKPAGASQEVVWSSDNNAIATVDETGKVTGVKSGRAVITASSKDDPSISQKVTIQVRQSTGDDLDFEGYEIRIAYSPGVEYELDPRMDTSNHPEYKVSPTRQYADQAWKEVEDKYNCKITVAGFPREDYWERFTYIIEQGKNNTTDFDIYWIPTNQISNVYSALLPLDDIYSQYGKGTMSEADLLARTYKKTLYGWSRTSGSITSDDPVIGLNVELLKKIDMEDEEPAKLFMEDKWNLDDFEAWCMKAQAKLNALSTSEDDKYYVISGRLSYWLRDLSRTSGVALADTLTMELNLTNPKVVDIADRLRRLFDAGCIDPANQVDGKVETWNTQHALLNTGSAYFVDYYNRWKAELWDENGNSQYGFVPWPYAVNQTHETARWATYTQDCFVIPKAITEKIKNASEDVTVENIFKVWFECFERAQQIMEAADNYDKEETDRIVARNKWDTEASVTAWLYIQNHLDTKGIFDPIKELRVNNGDGEEWERGAQGYIIPTLYSNFEATDYVAAVTPALANLKQTFIEKYN